MYTVEFVSLAAQVTVVEVMTPVIEASVWAAFHDHIFRHFPDRALHFSAWQIDRVWCGFAALYAARDVPCIVSRLTPMIHADTRMLDVKAGGIGTQGSLAHRMGLATSFGHRQRPTLGESVLRRLRPYSVDEVSRCRCSVMLAANLTTSACATL